MERVRYFSWLRVISCLAVIVLHTFYAAMSLFDEESGQYVVAMTMRNCMMWAVPCFVMVSGALLLDPKRNISYKKLFCVYVRRMLIALALSTLVYELMDCVLGLREFDLTVISDCLYKFATDGSWKNLWYLYLMIALYLMLPIFRKVTATSEKVDLTYIVGLFLLFMSLLPLVETLAGVESGFYITEHTIYPLYFFLGYAIHKGMIRFSKVWSVILAVCGGVMLIGMSVFSFESLLGDEVVRSLTASYSSPIILLLSVGLFSLMKQQEEACKEHAAKNDEEYRQQGGKGGINKIIDLIDPVTLEIYLVHMAVLKVIMVKVLGDDETIVGIGGIFVVALVVAIASVAISEMIYEVKKVCKK